MKIVTYNINGIRASSKLGLIKWIEEFDADVYCFQEVRCDENTAKDVLFETKKQLTLFDEAPQNNINKNYNAFFNCGNVAGYAGTLILSKYKPTQVLTDMGEFWDDNEGRTTTIIFNNLAIVNAYIPNGNSRLDFKMKYLSALTKFIKKLAKNYSVICVGDFNIAHNEIDLTNPKECSNKSVFLPIERQAFSTILNGGFIDTFRELNPKEIKYSWRSYRSRNDTNYNSWKYRIDYILCSKTMQNNLKDCDILDLDYSDHLPVVLNANIKKIREHFFIYVLFFNLYYLHIFNYKYNYNY